MRDTVGKISSRLLLQDPPTRDPIELEREMHKDFEDNIYECVSCGIKAYAGQYNAGNFYVVVLTKTERLMPNVIRNYFFHRKTCPTPQYDQAVYKCNKNQAIDFLWVVPSKDACYYFKNNALLVEESERDLLKFVLDFCDGTLDKQAKILNKEGI